MGRRRVFICLKAAAPFTLHNLSNGNLAGLFRINEDLLQGIMIGPTAGDTAQRQHKRAILQHLLEGAVWLLVSVGFEALEGTLLLRDLPADLLYLLIFHPVQGGQECDRSP
jgi:hypothetical protein